MKRFLYALSVLVSGGLLALVTLGLFVDEISYTATARVNAPIEMAWRTFMDGDRLGEWMPGFERVEHLSGDSLAPGAMYRLHFANGDFLTETIIAIVPYQEYSFDMETDLFTGQTSITFEDVGGAIRMQQSSRFRGTTFIRRALLPVLKPLIQREQMAALDRLADLIEQNPTPPEAAND